MQRFKSVETVLDDPNWRFTSLVPERNSCLFTYSNRKDIERFNFVDHRFLSGLEAKSLEVPLSTLMELNDQTSSQAVNFIWHTAFCGSTLIARSLGVEEVCLSIREPNVLMQLAMFKRNNPDFCNTNEFWEKLLKVSVNLLSRPFHEKEMVFIKPSNTMNNLIEDLYSLDARSKHLVLYSQEQDFLVSNLKKGPEYEVFCDSLLNLYSMDSIEVKGLVPSLDIKSPIYKASLAWRIQMQLLAESFINCQGADFTSRVKKCYFNDLLRNPSSGMKTVYDFYGLAVPDNKFEEAVVARVLNKHSKYDGIEYGKSKKVEEDRKIKLQFADEISNALQWKPEKVDEGLLDFIINLQVS